MHTKHSFVLPARFLEAIHSDAPSDGLTHSFYRYPARFSRPFARAAIQAFSQPRDVVLDPFMGSCTTLVEAIVQGRDAVGTDVNPLAQFIAKVKTSILSRNDVSDINDWLAALPS